MIPGARASASGKVGLENAGLRIGGGGLDYFGTFEKALL
jgi:hypothetical protein